MVAYQKAGCPGGFVSAFFSCRTAWRNNPSRSADLIFVGQHAAAQLGVYTLHDQSFAWRQSFTAKATEPREDFLSSRGHGFFGVYLFSEIALFRPPSGSLLINSTEPFQTPRGQPPS